MASVAARAYPRRTSWGLSLVVAFGHWLCTKDTMSNHSSQSSCCAVVYIWRYCSTHWFFCSDRPSVCGWNVVLMLQSMFNLVVSAFVKWDVKHGSLSEIIFVGTPNQGNMCSRYNLAIPSPVIIVLHGRNTATQEYPWSTMVSITSWLFDHGSWVIRSIAIVLKGHSMRSPGMLSQCSWHACQRTIGHVCGPNDRIRWTSGG